jgi:chromosome segregation ATPase
MRIIELRVQDFKKIKVARWKLDPHLNEIRGQNRQGKSSILDALFSALGGAKACPSEPIRSGSKSAKTVVDLGDLRITRTFSPSGTFLQVEDRDGDVKRAPQELLNSLGTALGMDPLAFVRADPKTQIAMLLTAFCVSVDDLAVEYKSVSEERTETNRELKRLRAAVEKIVVDPRATVMPIDVEGLKARRSELMEQRNEIDSELKRITELFDQSQAQQVALARLQDRENLEGEAEEVSYASETLTKRLEEIREEKRERLKSV